jgi:hypothetical protein
VGLRAVCPGDDKFIEIMTDIGIWGVKMRRFRGSFVQGKLQVSDEGMDYLRVPSVIADLGHNPNYPRLT